jgi:hypothetical protein
LLTLVLEVGIGGLAPNADEGVSTAKNRSVAMYSESRPYPPENRRLPLVLLFIVAAAGECFLLFVLVLGRRDVYSLEFPALVLKWILPFIYLLPLIAGRKAIRKYVSGVDSGSAEASLAIWQMFTTYIAMGAMEIGLTMFFGRH